MDIGLITTPDELDTIHCDGCSLDPIVQNLICGDGEQVVESEKNNRICDDCFIRTAQCTAECQAYEYESYNYYDPDESPAYYDYSDRLGKSYRLYFIIFDSGQQYRHAQNHERKIKADKLVDIRMRNTTSNNIAQTSSLNMSKISSVMLLIMKNHFN